MEWSDFLIRSPIAIFEKDLSIAFA